MTVTVIPPYHHGEQVRRQFFEAKNSELLGVAGVGAIEGGTFKSVERIRRGDSVLRHVKVEKDRASYKIVLTEDGTVERKVREARAEIEIPLAE